ncbi:MAG: ATP-binding cassette domain-containing protein, partial [Parvibaculaceae bacterium]
GRNFNDVNLATKAGEIVGVAGITGNGQSEFLRALAGLLDATGEVTLGKTSLKLGRPEAAYKAGVAFLSSDRQKEGLFMSLSVRENAALAALPRFAQFGVIKRRTERIRVDEQRGELAIRTPTIDTTISNLSGGNQQKVVLARALLFNASVILAEEPTAGVDVGARAEIYRILRDVADKGTPVIIVSSDLSELEGLCDRVIVFSRGHVVGELAGPHVTEEKIGRMMITATAQRKASESRWSFGSGKASGLKRFITGDYAPSLVLAVMILALIAYTAGHNIRFISGFNVEKMLLLTAALAFIAIGQMCAVFTSGIDLSVGPLVGLSVVIGSFFFLDGYSVVAFLLGLVCMFGAAALVGTASGSLVRFGNYTAVAATLGIYIIIQGISVLLRPYPDGNIGSDVIAWVQTSVGRVPLAFIVAIALAIILELALRYTRWGLSLRAVGSSLDSAARVGVAVNRTIVGAYIACSLLTALGGVMVMAQLGIGDANQGIGYTLSSIAAVVLGGASLFGGRGSFIGAVFGAGLIVLVNSTTAFIGLSDAWQYWFIGFLTLGAVAVYSQARRGSRHG